MVRLLTRKVPHVGLRIASPWLVLATVAILGLLPAVEERLRPELVMEKMSVQPVPPEAVVVTHQNDSCFLESAIVLEFGVPEAALDSWVRSMGFSPGNKSGAESLGRLSYPGDRVEVTVDWPHGLLRLDYLNV